MADVPSYLRRSTAILKMPEAIERGLSASAFLKELQAEGIGYRKTRFLADWRSVAGIEAKKDVVKYVRRDRRPSVKAIADVEWELSKEFMYKVKVMVQVEPDKPLQERFVNIMHDRLMTTPQVEAQVYSKWGEWERYAGEEIKTLQVVGVYHRVESPLEET
jgi:hypothetical protein